MSLLLRRLAAASALVVAAVYAPSPPCLAFSSTDPPTSRSGVDPRLARGRRSTSPEPLRAITKRQSFVLDGAELAYYVRSLARCGVDPPDVAPRARKKRDRAGVVRFVCAALDEDVATDRDEGAAEVRLARGTKVVGAEAPPPPFDDETVVVDEGVRLCRDSIAVVPPKVSDADAMSTAAASLLGVRCALLPRDAKDARKDAGADEKKKVVIVGGGEHAQFLARAHAGLGHDVSLVTARPSWSLPSAADLMPKGGEGSVDILPPAVGSLSLGFAAAIGEFDVLIDTLGDETGVGRATNLLEDEVVGDGGFLEQLKELHKCDAYISTLTRSQQYVLKEGLLFARDPVVRYQSEVEEPSRVHSILPPPPGFGSTLQRLFDRDVVRGANRNENGPHATKPAFVRGWSLSDLTELKTWPREGTTRYGFPSVDWRVSSATLRRRATATGGNAGGNAGGVASDKAGGNARVGSTAEGDSDSTEEASRRRGAESNAANAVVPSPESTANATLAVANAPSERRTESANHIAAIGSAHELHRKIVSPKRDCVLFVTASHCRKCHRMTPHFHRIARRSLESADVTFAHADVSSRPHGKQLGKVLQAKKVPSVALFRKGELIELGGEGEASLMVVDRRDWKRLEEVAAALDRGEQSADVRALLLGDAAKK